PRNPRGREDAELDPQAHSTTSQQVVQQADDAVRRAGGTGSGGIRWTHAGAVGEREPFDRDVRADPGAALGLTELALGIGQASGVEDAEVGDRRSNGTRRGGSSQSVDEARRAAE